MTKLWVDLTLSKYRFRFQTWTLYTIQITSQVVISYVDGVEVEEQAIK